MRLFLYEYLSAGGGNDLPPSLRREGWAMLAALAEDFAAIAGLEILTLLAPEVPRLGHIVQRAAAADEPEAFRACARRADATLIIAPEFDDLLAGRSQWALEQQGVLLGSPPEEIRAVSDKVRLQGVLEENRVPAPPIFLLEKEGLDPWAGLPYPLLLKPRFGAGCEGIRVLRSPEDLAPFLEFGDDSKSRARRKRDCPPLPSCAVLWDGSYFLQPFLPGTPASAAFLIGSKQTLPLLPGYQNVVPSGDGLAYLGGTLPLPEGLRERAGILATRALACFPGLRGFVGVDLLLGEAADGSADRVLEINARPTTSYVGLRKLCQNNLARLWWDLFRERTVSAPTWHEGAVRFPSDGSIQPF